MNQPSPVESPELSPVALPTRQAFQWATVYPLVIVVSAFFLLWPTARSLLSEWNDEANTTTYTHGYLIAAVSVWLLFRNRSYFRNVRLAPSLLACIALVITSVLWVVAVRAGIQTVHQVLMPVMMWLAVYAALGLKAALWSTFGTGYLYFAVPVWGYVNGVFQNLTVVAVEFLLRLSGVTAYVDGHFVHLASGVIEIANGCSGLHYVIVALAIGALYGEVSRDSVKCRVIQLALALLCAVITNWIRVYVIIVAGYLTDMQHYLVTKDHYTFGWFVFAAAMIVYFIVLARWQPGTAVVSEPNSEAAPTQQPRTAAAGLAVALVGLAIAPAWNLIVPVVAAKVSLQNELLPAGAGNWSGPQVPSSGWKPVFLGADATAQGVYQRNDKSVEAFVAVYALQTQGRELIGYGNSVLGEGEDSVVSITTNKSHAITELVTHRAGQQYLIWYGYRVGSLRTHHDIVAQAWYGLASLSGPVTSSVVALRTACSDDCDSARKTLHDFMELSAL